MYLTKCCCCLPLRNGLLLFAYLKIVGLITYASKWLLMVSSLPNPEYEDQMDVVVFVLGLVFQVIELIFVTLLIVGIHKQIVTIIRISYIYNVLLLGGEILFTVVVIPLKVYALYVYAQEEVWFSLLVLMISAPVIMALQLYTVILVRSQLLSMRKQCVSDPERSAYCNRKPYVVY